MKQILRQSQQMTARQFQALAVLQMTQLEISEYLEDAAEKNPLLEVRKCARRNFLVEAASRTSMYEYLLSQIRERFTCPHEREVALIFLHNLDEKGFISPPEAPSDLFVEKAHGVLQVLQTFDPPGIFAKDIRESFLLQLKAKGLAGSHAYRIVEECFEDLLHKRYKAIEKKLGSLDLSELVKLRARPMACLEGEIAVPITPDLVIERVQGGWAIGLLDDERVFVRDDYYNVIPDTSEEREQLKKFKAEAGQVFYAVEQRRRLLKSLARLFVRKQGAFLERKGSLQPLTVREVAEALGVHESTISRALSGKYASTPRGLLELRALITTTPEKASAIEILESLIKAEEKPLTDEELVLALKARGHTLARRTVAKYRKSLKIASATVRGRQKK